MLNKMAWEKNMKRGRLKDISSNECIVRRFGSDGKKNDMGQCRITIPKSIANQLKLKNDDRLKFFISNGKIFIEKSFGEL